MRCATLLALTGLLGAVAPWVAAAAPADAGPLPGSLHDLTFKNVTINGRPLTRADFLIGKTGVANVRFHSTP